MAQSALIPDQDLHQAFASEFHTKPGAAADLIAQHHAAIDPVVNAVSLHRRDDSVDGAELLKEADKVDLPEGHSLLDVAVRGDARRGQYLSYVAEDQNGRAYKNVAPYKGSTLPKVAPAAAAAHEQARSALVGQGALQRVLSEFEAKMAEMKAELIADFNKAASKVGEEAGNADGKTQSEASVPEREQRSTGSPGGTERTESEKSGGQSSGSRKS